MGETVREEDETIHSKLGTIWAKPRVGGCDKYSINPSTGLVSSVQLFPRCILTSRSAEVLQRWCRMSPAVQPQAHKPAPLGQAPGSNVTLAYVFFNM